MKLACSAGNAMSHIEQMCKCIERKPDIRKLSCNAQERRPHWYGHVIWVRQGGLLNVGGSCGRRRLGKTFGQTCVDQFLDVGPQGRRDDTTS